MSDRILPEKSASSSEEGFPSLPEEERQPEPSQNVAPIVPDVSGRKAETVQSGKSASGSEKARRVHSRIAQASKRILDQAKKLPPLPESSTARREKPIGRSQKAPSLVAGLTEHERALLVEVVDTQDRPLVCLPPKEALRQRLAVRMVAVALRTRQNKLILRKRCDASLGFAGRWDIYTGFVLVGEARKDAALRLLSSDAGLAGATKLFLAESNEPQSAPHPLTLFIVDLPAGLYPNLPAQDMLLVDADELDGLIRDMPELLSPELLRLAAAPGFFSGVVPL